MKQNVFLYDGDCSFCTDLALKLSQRSMDQEIRFLSFRNLSTEELKAIHPGLDPSVAQGNVQYVLGNMRYPGFFAVRRLSHSLRGWRWLSPLLYLPLVPILGMMVMSLLKSFKTRS
ncbi:DUF393 domain-containing protein [Leptospira langatensis]|uniref:DUF393 domain-containing protein n=1 Tax=Leptospira langatensis TaxID=2484983 RepID=A0A5F1ZYY7_9LEPT|nr:DCC1-like thiol-disulfide oxidoreductase family protein [Leptospira langatensis]TGJ98293.1 DUF393 domain-containing protein [Leptospira langatensis]TGL43207.1 DUF393 domain-containing protein [Leptospira langatensis]